MMPRSEERRSDGALDKMQATQVLGFAFDRVWVYAVFYSIALFAGEPSTMEVLEFAFLNKALSMGAMVIGLVGGALVITALLRVRFESARCVPLVATAASFMIVGTAILGFIDISDRFGGILLAASCGLTGLGSGVLFLCYFSAFSRVGSRVAIVEMGLGSAIAFLIVFVAVFLPAPALTVLALVSPAASAALLLLATRSWEEYLPEDAAADASAKTRRQHMRPVFIKMALGVFVLGVLQGFYDLYFGGVEEAATMLYNCSLFAVALIAALIVVFISALSLPAMTSNIYKVAMTLLALGCLFSGLIQSAPIFAAPLYFAGYVSFILLLTGVCIELSNNLSTPPLATAGFAFAILYVGELLGTFLAQLAISRGDALSDETVLMIAFALTILVILYLFTERDLVSLGFDADWLLGQSQAVATEPGMSQEEQRSQLCQLIGERYGLSARELDVLPLVLSGRTVARITEVLYISAGTVSTHLRHIYRKTGVSSKQELIDLAERIASEGFGGEASHAEASRSAALLGAAPGGEGSRSEGSRRP